MSLKVSHFYSIHACSSRASHRGEEKLADPPALHPQGLRYLQGEVPSCSVTPFGLLCRAQLDLLRVDLI